MSVGERTKTGKGEEASISAVVLAGQRHLNSETDSLHHDSASQAGKLRLHPAVASITGAPVLRSANAIVSQFPLSARISLYLNQSL